MRYLARLVIALLSILLATALAGCSASTVSVSDVAGMSADAAESRLDGLTVEFKDGTGNRSVMVGSNWTVTEQSLPAGTDVAEGSTIVLTVEKTTEMSATEETTGETAEETAEAVAEPTEETTAAPAAETTVAAAPPAASSWTMPDLVGQNLQVAQDTMQTVTGNPAFITLSDDATGQGRSQLVDSNWTVCSQSVAAGATFTDTDLITFAAVKIGEAC